MTSKELHKAIAEGNVALVQKLLTECQDINRELGLKGTPLCAAICANELSVAELLIKSGAKVNQADVDGEPLLSLAIRKKHQDMVKLLIRNGADVNKKDSATKLVPLCAAAQRDLVEVMRWLLDAGAAPNAQDSSDNTALHIATQKGNLVAMSLLLSRHCSARITNIAGNTPLHIAVIQGDLGALWLLVGCSKPYPKEPMTSAQIKSYLDEETLDKMLPKPDTNMAASVSDSCSCSSGRSSPQCEHGSTDTNRCDINQGIVFSKDTALHQAAFSGHINILKLLLHAGAKIDSLNNERQTPLLMACFKNRIDVARILLESGADPNREGSRKKFMHNYVLNNRVMIPLGLAAEHNNVALMELLLDYGAHFGKTSEPEFEEANPLFIALSRSATDAALCLLQNTHRLADTFNINFQRSYEGTFLFAVAKCEKGQITVAKKLIELGCDVNARQAAVSKTALHNAVDMECSELVELLIEHGADWSLTDKCGHNPLHTSILADMVECTKMLVRCGADINARSLPPELQKSGTTWSPLEIALDCQNFELAQYFLEAGADLTSEHYIFGNASPLGKAWIDNVYEEDEDLAERLIDLGHRAPSLTTCCVCRIRDYFRRNKLPFRNVSQLPIPTVIVDKILGQTSCLGR